LATDFSQIIKQSLKARSEAFGKLVEDATCLLCKENGRVGNLNILGRLVKLNSAGIALIVGDLHGDLESLIDIFNESKFLKKLDQTDDAVLIFLGDYGDRGSYSAEVYYTVLKLKLLYPKQVVLMRGNHEGPDDLMVDPHDIPSQLQIRFGEKWAETYAGIRKLFACLYNAVVVEERYLMIHGGLPPKIEKFEDLAYALLTHPKQNFLEDMLWSDPNEIVKETCVSPRGAGKLFGENVTRRVLERLGVKILIRGHEPCQEGFKIDHNGKVLTLFSRKGPPYFNAYGAYLDMDLSKKLENAQQLVQYIHKF